MNLLRELLRAVRNRRYEETEHGLFFPKAKLQFDNFFDIQVNDGPIEVFPNLVVNQWRTRALEILYSTASKINTYYLAPYAGNVAPQPAWTASNFSSNATEFTNYKEASRQEWEVGAVNNHEITNASSKAVFTVDGGGQTIIWGVGLLSSSGKGSASGFLVAANQAPSPRDNLVEDDEIAIGYTVRLQDAS
jgi:hypothetical protein